MLSFFRSTQAYGGLPFLLYAALLQVPVFFGPAAPNLSEATGYGALGLPVATWAAAHPWVAAGLPILLIALLALQASLLANRHRFTRMSSQMAPLGVLLVYGLVPGFRTLHPAMLANLFLGFAALSVLSIYKNPQPQYALFNTGAMLAVASFFAPAYLLFLLPCYVASGIMGRTGLLEIIRLLTGVVAIYFLAGTVAYFYGALPAFTAAQTPRFSIFLRVAPFPWLPFVGLLFLLSLVLPAQAGVIVRSINIEGSKGVDSLYWMLLFAPLALLFSGGIAAIDTYLLIFPAGILLGLFIGRLAERQAELMHLLLLVAALACGSLHLLVANT